MAHEQLIDEGQRHVPDRRPRRPAASGRPEHIKEECDTSLARLRVDCIELYQVHVPDPDVPYEDTVGAFVVPIAGTSKIAHAAVNIAAPCPFIRFGVPGLPPR